VCNRIKYTDEKKCIDNIILLGIGYEAWLICDNEDASKKFVAISKRKGSSSRFRLTFHEKV